MKQKLAVKLKPQSCSVVEKSSTLASELHKVLTLPEVLCIAVQGGEKCIDAGVCTMRTDIGASVTL